MKVLAQWIVIVLLTVTNGVAGPNDIQFTVTRKKLDEQRKREGGNQTVTTKEIAYKVTVQNKSFKEVKDVEVKYMVFYDDAKEASTEKAREASFTGRQSIPMLQGNQSETFDTNPLKLTTTELDGGWYYANGGGNRAKDRVIGVWFRAYSNGEMIGEYVNPTSLAKRQVWKD